MHRVRVECNASEVIDALVFQKSIVSIVLNVIQKGWLYTTSAQTLSPNNSGPKSPQMQKNQVSAYLVVLNPNPAENPRQTAKTLWDILCVSGDIEYEW